MMLHVANSSLNEIEDGATIASRGVALVRPLSVSPTMADTTDVLACRRGMLFHRPSRGADRFVISERTVVALRFPLPQRVLSP
jgi:hypothetical protein